MKNQIAVPAAAPAPAPMQEEADAGGELADRQAPARSALKSAISRAGSIGANKPDYKYAAKQSQQLDSIDPNARIQTGPGLPSWQWREYPLVWSGPVQHTQRVKLWLLSPPITGLLTVVQMVLLVLLFLRLADVKRGFGKALSGTSAAFAVLACAAALASLGASERVEAANPATPSSEAAVADTSGAAASARPSSHALPDAELLEQLKQKLLAAPECLPACATLPRLRIEARGDALQLRIEAHAEVDAAVPLPGGANQWSPQRVLLDGKPAVALARGADGTLWALVPKGVHQLALESSLSGRDAVQLGLPLRPQLVEANLDGWKLDGLNETGAAGESLLLTRLVTTSAAATGSADGETLPPFVVVERTLNLGLTWTIATRLTRSNASRAPALVAIPLLAGESVTQSDIRVDKGSANVNLGPQTNEFEFQSSLKIGEAIVLKAPTASNQIHRWRLNLGPQWHAELSGIPVIHHQDNAANWMPQWQPWPGEEVNIALTRPLGVEGQTLTIDSSLLQVAPGIRATDTTLSVSLRSSRGVNHSVTLPPASTLLSVAINGQTQPIRLEGNIVRLPVVPGKQEVQIAWRENRGVAAKFATSNVDVGVANVNSTITLSMPQDRWTLFAGGSRVGPAMLIWGVLIALLPIAYGLSRTAMTPLKWYHWLLLGIGLTQTSVPIAILVVGWFFAMATRRRYADAWEKKWLFNLRQIALVIWTLLLISALFEAIRHGLLGLPEMQVAGNGSHAYHLRWYQDRNPAQLPVAWAISVPLAAYRILMLLWALWLAYALLKWLRWGWECYSSAGIWRRIEWPKPKSRTNPRGVAEPATPPQQ